MAYVVARPKGRFEIRESVHTPKGPRARSLANFAVLTDDVVQRARRRAIRPFDAVAVRAAAVRVSAERAVEVPRHEQREMRRFVETSRRMATTLERVPDVASRQDPGDALIGLLGFVDAVAPHTPSREPEPLTFPPLAGLLAGRRGDERRS
jgi:hypothetical protein